MAIASASSLAMVMTGQADSRSLSRPHAASEPSSLSSWAKPLGVDGISDFDGLYSGQHNDEIQLYAFDILALDGDDLRKLPLHLRKTNLALAGKAACNMMLEGLVSKRRDSRYRAGPSRDWIKIKNPASPAMNRTKDAFG
jgi:bifunctional non-homologous end joining protein LigD